jgi:two-component system, NtrC family, response regulator GlrR
MPPSILVVDDDVDLVRLFARILTRAGYPVRTAADGEEALAAIATELPSLVLTDLQMPRLPGQALIAQLQRQYPQVHIVVMSALGSSAAQADLPFLTKPVSSAVLLSLVQATLAPER